MSKTNSAGSRVLWLLLAAILTAGFSGLGIWQLFRLDYKLDLIHRVESRAYGSPTELPGPAEWDSISKASSEYLRVQAVGQFEPDKAQKSLAVTEKGRGYWLMVPFKTQDGFVVWVNSGFVSSRDEAVALPKSQVQLIGLLRLTEPDGGFLNSNKPEQGRWYSRDVQAMSNTSGVTHAAPYFVDAFTVLDVLNNREAKPYSPLKALTVLHFSNHHLQYALTWFVMALCSVGITVWLLRGRVHSSNPL